MNVKYYLNIFIILLALSSLQSCVSYRLYYPQRVNLFTIDTSHVFQAQVDVFTWGAGYNLNYSLICNKLFRAFIFVNSGSIERIIC